METYEKTIFVHGNRYINSFAGGLFSLSPPLYLKAMF
jgi:hypothetical protein